MSEGYIPALDRTYRLHPTDPTRLVPVDSPGGERGVNWVDADGQPIRMVKVELPLNLWGWWCPQCDRYTEAYGRGQTIADARCEYCGAGYPEAGRT